MVTRARAAKRMVASYKRRSGEIAYLVEKRGKRDVSFIIRHCVVCGAAFFAVRSDAQTCDARCRQRLHRQRVKQQQQDHKDRAEQLSLKGIQ